MAEALVLLPGMMCDARLFAAQVADLSRDTAVMVAPITRGERIEEIASGLLDSLPQRFALAGLSMGGIVAMEILRRAPDRVMRIALMDTNPLSETPQVAADREPQIVRVRAGRLDEVMRDEMKPNYLAEGPGKQAVMDLCMAMAMDIGPDVFIRQSVALRDRPDQQESLRNVEVPTLVLCGRDDKLCPLERHELMHGLIPGSRLEIIEGAAHMPTLEQPDATTDALCGWLER